MLIGLGGGAASSLTGGAAHADLDFASVQRDNAEMERRCQEVIDRCWALGDDNPIAFYNSCGHGLCRDCWKSLVSAAIVSSSTPAVKSGEDLTGAVTVLSMKCSADPDGKCQAKIDSGVLCQAVPHLVQPFIRSTMSNLSRLLLSGGAGTCQCVCGSVVSGVCHTHHILKSVLSHPSFRRLFLILKSSANAATFSALLT
jgi:hypothetical protein